MMWGVQLAAERTPWGVEGSQWLQGFQGQKGSWQKKLTGLA